MKRALSLVLLTSALSLALSSTVHAYDHLDSPTGGRSSGCSAGQTTAAPTTVAPTTVARPGHVVAPAVEVRR